IWDMIVGKSGRLPGPLGEEIIALAKQEGREFYNGHPQDLYPDALDTFRKEMNDNGWDYGQDDEELFELAMHPEQYRRYKAGQAKADFEKEIAEAKAEAAKEAAGGAVAQPTTMYIEVEGQKYKVNSSYDGSSAASAEPQSGSPAPAASGNAEAIVSPLEGKFYFTKDSSEKAIKVGDRVEKGDLLGYIEAMKTYNRISADKPGVITEIKVSNGASVDEDDVLMMI